MTDPQFSIPIDFVADLNAKRGASMPIEREHEDLFPIVPEHWRFVLTSDRDRMRQVEA